MSQLNLLIAKAASIVGNERKLAKTLDIPQTHISGWKAGTRTCTPEDRARIAACAGEDAIQELVRAVIEKHEGTRKGEQLELVLGKRLHQIGGAVATGLLSLLSLSYGSEAHAYLIRCILLLSRYRAHRSAF